MEREYDGRTAVVIFGLDLLRLALDLSFDGSVYGDGKSATPLPETATEPVAATETGSGVIKPFLACPTCDTVLANSSKSSKSCPARTLSSRDLPAGCDGHHGLWARCACIGLGLALRPPCFLRLADLPATSDRQLPLWSAIRVTALQPF